MQRYDEPRSAEWLETEHAAEEDDNRRERQKQQELEMPGGRPLDFCLDLAKDFIWLHPLKTRRKPVRSTVVTCEELPSETLWT